MNWDAIGAIAELLGAVGVIASLVYLATQIRQSRTQMGQNTTALRASSQQAVSENLNELLVRATSDPENLRVVSLGMTDITSLEGEDLMRFLIWAGGLLGGYENAHYQYRVGLLDEDRWGLYRMQLTKILSTDNLFGLHEFWKSGPLSATPEFVALVEEILGEEPDRGDG